MVRIRGIAIIEFDFQRVLTVIKNKKNLTKMPLNEPVMWHKSSL